MKSPGSVHHACMSQEFDNKPGQRYSTLIRIILIKNIKIYDHKLLSRDWCVALPRGVVDLSAVCDYGMSRS